MVFLFLNLSYRCSLSYCSYFFGLQTQLVSSISQNLAKPNVDGLYVYPEELSIEITFQTLHISLTFLFCSFLQSYTPQLLRDFLISRKRYDVVSVGLTTRSRTIHWQPLLNNFVQGFFDLVQSYIRSNIDPLDSALDCIKPDGSSAHRILDWSGGYQRIHQLGSCTHPQPSLTMVFPTAA